MEKHLGKEIANAAQREAYLKDNCDACEQKGYMKPYTASELQGHKENLANVSIQISEIETFAKINGRDVSFILLSLLTPTRRWSQ